MNESFQAAGAGEKPVTQPSRRLSGCAILGLGGIVLVIGLIVLLVVEFLREQEEIIASCCQCPLGQMGLGLQNYHCANGCLPPAYRADKDGIPMHSWRVLMLPYMELQPLHDQYCFDEPWNDSRNARLADKMPPHFHQESEPPSSTFTNLVLITGPGTAFPGSGTTRMQDITDGADNTILMAEISNSDIPWMEPRDLHVERMSFRINDPSLPSISCSRQRGPYVAFADERVYALSPSLSPETLKALTTISGGEKMYMADLYGTGLASLAPGPATDETLKELKPADLARIRILWLTRCDITDRGLAYIATAPSLCVLHLRGTRITDEGLRHLSGLKGLGWLDLCHTQVSDEGLAHLVALPGDFQLVIDVKGTRVTIAGIARFLKSLPEPEFPSVTRVEIEQGSVTQEGMDFGGSTITDVDLEHFQGLASLRGIILARTRITDAGLRRLASFKKLRNLDLTGTQVTDEGVRRFQKALPDCGIQR